MRQGSACPLPIRCRSVASRSRQALFGPVGLDGVTWLPMVALAAGTLVLVEIETALLRRLGIRRL
jgi:hypothetical protein